MAWTLWKHVQTDTTMSVEMYRNTDYGKMN